MLRNGWIIIVIVLVIGYVLGVKFPSYGARLGL